jgi:hypothetical protein
MRTRLGVVVSALAVTAACSSAPSGKPATDASNASSGAPATKSAEAAATSSGTELPKFKEIVVPAGTTLNLTLETAVSSDESRPEDQVRATLSKPIVVDGMTVVKAGAEATGSILQANQSGRVKGLASVSFRFDRLHAGDETHKIHTARISRQAQSTKKQDAAKIGIGTGAGALIGAIAGGGKGAALGSAVGAGAGTGVVMSTRGKEVHLPAGTAVKTTLDEPVTIQIPLG